MSLVAPADFPQKLRFRYTAWRLETLQSYGASGEDERLQCFLRGERQPASPNKDAWLSLIRDNLAAGRTMGRVHVVEEPLTDYMRYELSWGYAPNVEAGEDIRIIPVSPDESWPDNLPREDYWLLDSAVLYRMHYASDGAWLGAELISAPEEIVHANWTRDVAVHHALPYREYMRRHPDLVKRVSA